MTTRGGLRSSEGSNRSTPLSMEESRQVIVRAFQREPAGILGSIPEPLGDKGGLAETGWGGYGGQRALQGVVETPHQVRPWNEASTRPGDEGLGRKKWLLARVPIDGSSLRTHSLILATCMFNVN